MNIPKTAIKRPVTTLMIMMILILVGAISLVNTRLDLLPQINVPIIGVMVSFPGASPREVADLVTEQVEGLVTTVRGVTDVNSYSMEHMSLTMAQLNWGADLKEARADLAQILDRLQLPEGASAPSIIKFDPTMLPVMQVSVASSKLSLDELYEFISSQVQPRIEAVDGVATVNVTGAAEREVQVLVDQDKLKKYNLTLSQVASVIMAGNLTMPAGSLSTNGKELNLRMVSKLNDLDELKDLPIYISTSLPAGQANAAAMPMLANPAALAGLLSSNMSFDNALMTTPLEMKTIRLKDIANIEVKTPTVTSISRSNGQPSLRISIQKEGEANTTQVARAVNKQLDTIKKQYSDLNFTTILDQGEYIEMAIDSVTRNLLLGAILAIAILWFFLRNIRSTLVIGIAIPFSIIVTFVLIYLRGLTINVMTLGGLALGVGMLVDNAIVVLENIHRRSRELGEAPAEAAERGTNQVLLAITASTLTTMAVFLPVVYIGGLTGELFKELALTVTFSLLASLVVAATVIPVLATYFMKSTTETSKNATGFYLKILHWALQHRRATLAIAFLLLAASLATIPFIGTEFMPTPDEGAFSVTLSMPPDTALDVIDKRLQAIEQVIMNDPDVENVMSNAGSSQGMSSLSSMGGSPGRGSIAVMLKDESGPTQAVIDRVSPAVRAAAGDAEVNFDVESQMAAMSGGHSRSLQLEVSGPNIDTLYDVVAAVQKDLAQVPGLSELQNNLAETLPELQVTVDREKALKYGLMPATVGSALSDAQRGRIVTRLHHENADRQVRLILQPQQRDDQKALEQLLLKGMTGENVELKQVASIVEGVGPLSISRTNRQPTAQITGLITGRDLGSVTNEVARRVEDMKLPSGYIITLSGASQMMTESLNKLLLALLLAIVLIYMIMASQFESFIHPFVILFSMPLALVGVLVGLLISGYSLGATAMVGMVVLAGIVVNNAIVLVDFINQSRKSGLSLDDAIIEAGRTRLRPIIMTALTTILGLVPLAFGFEEGTQIMAPMAIAVIGGLLTSTLLTLVVVPVVYHVVNSKKVTE